MIQLEGLAGITPVSLFFIAPVPAAVLLSPAVSF